MSQTRHFERLKEVLRSPFGTVYQGAEVDKPDHRVGLYFADADEDEGLREAYRQRRGRVGRFRHPLAVRDRGLGLCEDRTVFVCEEVDGVTLTTALMDAPFPPSVSIELALRLARLLHAGWDRKPRRKKKAYGIIHGDLSPDQVLIETDGLVRVMGMGSGTPGIQAPRDALRRKLVFPTAYTAPEALSGRDSHAGDIYALASILAHMCTGTLPSFASTQREWHEGTAQGVADRVRETTGLGALGELVGWCLAYRPSTRPPASEVEEWLQRLAAKHDQPAAEAWLTSRLPFWRDAESETLELANLDGAAIPPPDNSQWLGGTDDVVVPWDAPTETDEDGPPHDTARLPLPAAHTPVEAAPAAVGDDTPVVGRAPPDDSAGAELGADEPPTTAPPDPYEGAATVDAPAGSGVDGGFEDEVGPQDHGTEEAEPWRPPETRTDSALAAGLSGAVASREAGLFDDVPDTVPAEPRTGEGAPGATAQSPPPPAPLDDDELGFPAAAVLGGPEQEPGDLPTAGADDAVPTVPSGPSHGAWVFAGNGESPGVHGAPTTSDQSLDPHSQEALPRIQVRELDGSAWSVADRLTDDTSGPVVVDDGSENPALEGVSAVQENASLNDNRASKDNREPALVEPTFETEQPEPVRLRLLRSEAPTEALEPAAIEPDPSAPGESLGPAPAPSPPSAGEDVTRRLRAVARTTEERAPLTSEQDGRPAWLPVLLLVALALLVIGALSWPPGGGEPGDELAPTPSRSALRAADPAPPPPAPAPAPAAPTAEPPPAEPPAPEPPAPEPAAPEPAPAPAPAAAPAPAPKKASPARRPTRRPAAAKRAPKPAPPPPPEPEPAPEPAAEPAAAEASPTGSWSVGGDAAGVRLVGQAGNFPAGSVPAGSYTIMATFADGAPPTAAGTVQVTEGSSLQVHCQSTFMACRTK